MKLTQLLLEISTTETFNDWISKKLITQKDVQLIQQVTDKENFQKWLGDEMVYKRYRDILGRCSGGKIEFCTIANNDRFDEYLETDNLYVIYNYSNPLSPYQVHFESNSFLDRTNMDVIESLNDNIIFDILDFIQSKSNVNFVNFIKLLCDSINIQLNDEFIYKKYSNMPYVQHLMAHDHSNVVMLSKYGVELKNLPYESKKEYLNNFFMKLIEGKIDYAVYKNDVNYNTLDNEDKLRFIEAVLKTPPSTKYYLGYYGLKLEYLDPLEKMYYFNKLIKNHLIKFNEQKYNIKLSDLPDNLRDDLISVVLKRNIPLQLLNLSLDDLNPQEKQIYLRNKQDLENIKQMQLSKWNQ